MGQINTPAPAWSISTTLAPDRQIQRPSSEDVAILAEQGRAAEPICSEHQLSRLMTAEHSAGDPNLFGGPAMSWLW